MAYRYVKPLTAPEIDRLTPQRLDAYRKKLLSLEESAELSDMDSSELNALDPSLIHFKEDARWTEQMQMVVVRLRRAPT